MSNSYTITCPSCGNEWNTLKVGRRARTCPKCGHVGPRAAFAERPTATNGHTPPAPPGEGGDVNKPKNGEDNGKPKRKLVGAAAAAHAAKERGEPVTVGKPFGSAARSSRRRASSSSSGSTTTTSAKPVGILERLKRVVV